MSNQGIMLMPAMGEGIIEAKLVRWLKKPGEAVAQDEPIVEVATDKVDSEVPAPFAGILQEYLAQEGEQVAINAPLARIAHGSGAGATTNVNKGMKEGSKASEKTAEKSPVQRPEAPVAFAAIQQQPPLPLDTDSGVRSSPLVRKIAKEHQVNLQQVAGTGLAGRITRQDLESHLNQRQPAAPANPPAARNLPSAPLELANAVEVKTPHKLQTKWVEDQEYLDGVRVKRERMSHMRQLIGEHMERSVRTSPHVTTTIEIDLHRVNQIREQHKESFQKREGFSLTYTAFFIYAAAQAIKAHPIINVSVDGQEILFKNDINIGVAVSLGAQGLIVPVIKNAGELNLLGIARRLQDLVSRARSKRLNPDDVRGGTFSLTNPGSYGSLHSNPIINQPQVAIMSVGCVTKRPVVLPGDLIGIRPIMIAGLTFDHRVIDGEAGAKFLASIREILEGFEEMPV